MEEATMILGTSVRHRSNLSIDQFGQSDRSRIILGDDIIPDERGVMVRSAARFGIGVGSGQR
jgi:hypothetical protein